MCVGLGGVVLLPVQAESDLGWDWCRKVGVRCCCCGWSGLGRYVCVWVCCGGGMMEGGEEGRQEGAIKFGIRC